MECPICAFDNIPGAGACEDCGGSLRQEDLPLDRARSRLARSLNKDHIVEVLDPAKGVTVPESTPLDEAVQMMREQNLDCLLVTDGKGKLSGIFTERDLLNKVAGLEEDLGRLQVAQFMTARPETVREDRVLAYALHRMMVGDYRHLPLTDREHRPVGIISSRDIIDYLTARYRKTMVGLEEV
jgi:CBS domain-containing protein